MCKERIVGSSAHQVRTFAVSAPDQLKVNIGGREVTLETGEIGRQAGGAVLITDGDTVLYATACCSDEPSSDGSFVPLQVNYSERMSAAGRTSSSFIKRDGRPRDGQILVSRLIDRPLRPMFVPGWSNETQVLCELFSYDGVHLPEPLAITAAGAALVLSDIPLAKAVAGVRVGRVDGTLLANPTVEQMAGSDLDLMLAGTSDAVLMIEGFCEFLSDAEMVEAVAFGAAAVLGVCTALEEWGRKRGKPKRTSRVLAPPGLEERIRGLVGTQIEHLYRTISGKQERGNALYALKHDTKMLLVGEGVDWQLPQRTSPTSQTSQASAAEEGVDDDVRADNVPVEEDTSIDPPPPSEIDYPTFSLAYKAVESGIMRRLVLEEGLRADGRGPDEVRPIQARVGLLPRTHGSALFTRGETQVLATTTLGSSVAAQRLDGLTDEEEARRFYLQYFFPPSSVGEVGRVGAPGRREIGHGALAERALAPIVPDEESFPYTVRVESTVTESNGSSSMASVCGGCLALMDAGVPVKRPVAGVAMGLILEASGRFMVLTDILGSEDALGDMDFKVAGDADSITAFQMDIKVEGITLPVLEQALAKARSGIRHILGEMSRCLPATRGERSIHAPCIIRVSVDPEKLGIVIGSGGKTVKGIMLETGTEIQIVDNPKGLLEIIGDSEADALTAREMVIGVVTEPEPGKIYRGVKVSGLEKFGMFVEFLPGRQGLVHVSELDLTRSSDASAFSVGDIVDVKLLEVAENNRFRLSRRAVLMEDAGIVEEEPEPLPEVGTVFREVPVTEVLAFGLLVEYQPGRKGLLHVSEVDVKRVADLSAYPVGSTLDVQVIEMGPKDRIRLSRKALQLAESPKPQVGDIFRNAPVVKTSPFGCFVKLSPTYTGLVHKSELDLEPVANPAAFAEEHGNVFDVEVIEVIGSKLNLSRKAVLLKEQPAEQPASEAEAPSTPRIREPTTTGIGRIKL